MNVAFRACCTSAIADVGKSQRFIQRFVQVEADEIPALLWSCAYFFCVLCCTFVVRPLRDEMGIAGGVGTLPWLFLGTLLSMVLLNPLFAALVARFPARRFIPLVYRFFALCLLGFLGLLSAGPVHRVAVARALFIFGSIFNLFVVSVFWGTMADRFHSTQGKRLFGLIGAAGTLGGLCGSAVAAGLAERIGPARLLIVAALLLEAAVFSFHRLMRHDPLPKGVDREGEEDVRDNRGVLSGVTAVVRSPYLLMICVYLLLYTLSSTCAYFAQARIASASIAGSATRTAFFARIDLWVNLLTLFLQGLATGRVISAIGLGPTLTVLPAVTALGFVWLGLVPHLAALVAFQVVRRATDYSLSKPAREVLYTVVGRKEKYAAKSLIDTVVYRSGDALGAWTAGLLGSGVPRIAIFAVPLAIVWIGVAIFLGRRQARMVSTQAGQG